jgi:hypothetical protein
MCRNCRLPLIYWHLDLGEPAVLENRDGPIQIDEKNDAVRIY